MNKNSKHKLLAITFLLSLLSIYSMYAALIPVVQATEPNIQDKAMAVLSDVVGINTESYATNLNSQVDKEYRGLTEKEVNLYFSSEQSQLRASCTFVNNNLHLIYISDYEGTPSLKRSSANTADMAKGCLKEYENYAGDAFYGGLASMLDMIDAGANSTKIVGNIKLDVLNLGNIVDYTWTYADDNGVIAQLKSVLLSYEGGRLKSFLNNWPLYTIAGTAKISIEEATSIAVEASKNFSYELNTDNGTMTVSGFKVAPESLSHQALSYLNFPDQNTARGGDPFTLYPSWYVPLGFDKFYPGDVTGMTVTIWADTGEVSSTSPMVCDIGSQSTVEGEIDTEIEQGSTILSSSTAISGSIVIAAIFIVAGCLFLTRRNESTSACMRKLFHPKFWGIMLIASIVFSSVLITIPMANATGSDLIRSKAMIYASLHDQVDNEPDAAEEVTDYIEQCFLENGYSTTNLCGEGTTVSNVMNYTQSSENTFGRVAAFHFGHYYDPYESYQDNNGVPVCADDISDYTESQKHFFVWIWACKQAYNASYRMPVAWTHREPGTGGYMSNDGYFTTDSGDHCFITFDGGSPQIGNSSGTFNCSETGPLKNFIMLFYDYALEEVSGGGYTVKGSLDRASLDFFDCNYENCVISDWYHGAWWPGPEPEATYYPGRMLVFGNGDIKLYQPQLYLSARDTNNNQVLPTFTIDGYPFSTQYVRLVPGAHIINVSDETG
jgi:hypothetical protein